MTGLKKGLNLKIKIIPEDYRVIVKANNKLVLVIENMYEVLCQTHAILHNMKGRNKHENLL